MEILTTYLYSNLYPSKIKVATFWSSCFKTVLFLVFAFSLYGITEINLHEIIWMEYLFTLIPGKRLWSCFCLFICFLSLSCKPCLIILISFNYHTYCKTIDPNYKLQDVLRISWKWCCIKFLFSISINLVAKKKAWTKRFIVT